MKTKISLDTNKIFNFIKNDPKKVKEIAYYTGYEANSLYKWLDRYSKKDKNLEQIYINEKILGFYTDKNKQNKKVLLYKYNGEIKNNEIKEEIKEEKVHNKKYLISSNINELKEQLIKFLIESKTTAQIVNGLKWNRNKVLEVIHAVNKEKDIIQQNRTKHCIYWSLKE